MLDVRGTLDEIAETTIGLPKERVAEIELRPLDMIRLFPALLQPDDIGDGCVCQDFLQELRR